MSVFASVSQAGRRTSTNPREHWNWKSAGPVEVDEIHISEGVLRPADLDSEAEKLEYPSGEAMFIAEQAEKQEKRKSYPRPLGNLVEAREFPDDWNLLHYYDHLNQIRREPDPELFRQFIASMYERSLSRQSDLKAILIDRRKSLEPWEPEKRAFAIKTLY